MNTELQKRNPNEAQARRNGYRVPVYLVERDGDRFLLQVDLPGVSREAISVNLDHRTLTVEGRRELVAPESWKPVYREIPDRDFRLVLDLNVDIDESGIRAQTHDGVLVVELPVAEKARVRTIAVE